MNCDSIKNPWSKFSNASPQREEGHREISNDVFMALIKADLSGAEYKVALFIIDRTWGFNKKSDSISISQFCGATGLADRTIHKVIKSLKAKRIIHYEQSKKTRVHTGSPLNEFLFNKHHDTWISQGCINGHGCTKVRDKGEQMGATRVTKCSPTKETITKETIQKKTTIAPNREKTPGSSAPKLPKINLNTETWQWENITDLDKSRWATAYPACDLLIELTKASEWIRSNPTKIKKNWLRFITNWLSRSQERGGSNGARAPNQKQVHKPATMEEDDYYSGYKRA